MCTSRAAPDCLSIVAQFKSKKVLKEKLLYAIKAASGFELS